MELKSSNAKLEAQNLVQAQKIANLNAQVVKKNRIFIKNHLFLRFFFEKRLK